MLGWVAVLLGSVCIYFFGWSWLDAALAIAISVFVVYNVARQPLRRQLFFLQGNPDPQKLRDFRDCILKFPEVLNLHDLHFWSLDGSHHVLSMHVVTSLSLTESFKLKGKIRSESHRLGECHLTIEVESPVDHCNDSCDESGRTSIKR